MTAVQRFAARETTAGPMSGSAFGDALCPQTALPFPYRAIPPTRLLGVIPGELVVALPVAACFAVPMLRYKRIIYLYDLLTVVAIVALFRLVSRAPSPRPSRLQSVYNRASWFFGIGIVLGGLSAGLRTYPEIDIHTVGHTGQFLLAMIYARLLLSALVAGTLSADRFVRWVMFGVLFAAIAGLVQYVVWQVNPGIAMEMHQAYLDLGGMSDDRFGTGTSFIEKVNAVYEATGTIRIMGTWDVPTTFGGMMSLGAGWLLLAGRMRQTWKVVCFCLIGLAVLFTMSRHGWALMLLTAFFLGGRTRLVPRIAVAVACLALLLGGALLADRLLIGRKGVFDSSFEQARGRIERTVDRGLGDRSIEARYVEGTIRFVEGVRNDPTYLLAGFGIGTEHGLEKKYGPAWFAREWEAHQFGFVSNSWLLSVRLFGLCGLAGLVLMHFGLLANTGTRSLGPIALSGLIFLADNYAIFVPRCFFLLMAYLAVVWALAIRDSLVQRSRRMAFATSHRGGPR